MDLSQTKAKSSLKVLPSITCHWVPPSQRNGLGERGCRKDLNRISIKLLLVERRKIANHHYSSIQGIVESASKDGIICEHMDENK